jgi:hypothetical protein
MLAGTKTRSAIITRSSRDSLTFAISV